MNELNWQISYIGQQPDSILIQNLSKLNLLSLKIEAETWYIVSRRLMKQFFLTEIPIGRSCYYKVFLTNCFLFELFG